MQNKLPDSSCRPVSKTKGGFSHKHILDNNYMISEGRLEYLEELALSIERYEKWEPRWDKLKMSMSAFGALALGGLSIILPARYVENLQLNTSGFLQIITILTIISILGLGICFWANGIHNKERKEQYANEATKIKDIIKKIRASLIVEDPKLS